jgi:NitT/TauT family transport system substrate-binding protein
MLNGNGLMAGDTVLKLLKCLMFLLMTMVSCANAKTDVIRIALDDLPGVDMLPTLIAIERAKTRGVAIKVSYMLSEGMAMRSILNKQADIGMGTPYQKMQQTGAPIRMFYQLNRLRFHPVVDTRYVSSWGELDGTDMYSHGEGSGTEALVNMMAKKHGITYGKMVYLPGSGVRANAMVNGRVHATVVDTERKNKLIARANSPFKVLPIETINATDEALFANQAFIRSQHKKLSILVEELLFVWNAMNSDPQFILDQRNSYGLLPDLMDTKVLRYTEEMVAEGAFSNDGGRETAFEADMDFYGFAGTIKMPEDQKVDQYWDFSILDQVTNASKASH